MDMECNSTADRIARVLSGNAAPEDEELLRSHGAGCPACADQERRLRRTWALMGQLRPLASRAAVPAAPRRAPWRRAVLAAAAAAVLVSLALFALRSPRSAPSQPEVSPVARATPAPALAPMAPKVEPPVAVPEPAPPVAAPVPPAPEAVPAPRPTQAPAPRPLTPPPSETAQKPPVPLTRPESPVPPEPRPAVASVPPVPAIATLGRVEGNVFATSGAQRVQVQAGHKLVSGDALETVGKNGQALLDFEDGTRLVLGSETTVDTSLRSGGGKQVSLKQGTVSARIARQPMGEPMIFATATAEARVLGTRLTLSVTPSSTRLEVREGKVRFMRKEDGAVVEVSADRFAVAGKGVSLAPRPTPALRVAMHEMFDAPRLSGAWLQAGEPNSGIRWTIESGSLSVKTLQKPSQDLGSKLPSAAGDLARKVPPGAASGTSASKKEWPRSAWVETRQAFPFTNEAPLRIRTRAWNSHADPDRTSWFGINRGVPGQGFSLERRGDTLRLWVEGAAAPMWEKEVPSTQEWETLELWISKDQVLVRRNDETLCTENHALKVKGGALALGVGAKPQLAQDEEIRFEGVDVFLSTRAEFEEVAR